MDEYRNQTRECAVACTQFRDGSPDDLYNARWYGGIAMEWMRQPHGALQAYHEAASLMPNADPCLYAARIYRQLGENQRALDMLDEAARREPWRKEEFTSDDAGNAE